MKSSDAFISEQIRQFRILKNRTQEELGNYMELPKQAISRIEKGERKVTYTELSKIAEFLEEPLDALVVEDVKNKLIRVGNSIASIPKFVFDNITDYKKFLKRGYSKEEAKVITDEIINQYRNAYENMYLSPEEQHYFEQQREIEESKRNESNNIY